MLHQKKGIVIKIENGEQLLLIHRETLMDYLSSIGSDGNGWSKFKLVEKVRKERNVSHTIYPKS